MSEQITDRELLELAARAARYTWVNFGESGAWWHDNPDLARPWNPLTDDGDALRLAVKLRFHLAIESNVSSAWLGGMRCWNTEQHNDDDYAATRRAIVRAAAEVGKAMLESAAADTPVNKEVG